MASGRVETSPWDIHAKWLSDLDSQMNKRSRTIPSKSFRVRFLKAFIIEDGKGFWANGILFPARAASHIVSHPKGRRAFLHLNHSCPFFDIDFCEPTCSNPKRGTFSKRWKWQVVHLVRAHMHLLFLREENATSQGIERQRYLVAKRMSVLASAT